MVEIHKIYDLANLMRWRQEVLRHVFGKEPSAQLLEKNRRYYRQHIVDNSHLAIVALWDSEEAGCGAICFTEELPSPDNPNGKCAYLMNVYVREHCRKHGIAHAIVTRLIEEARRRDCTKIYLETTQEGRQLYESIGFCDLPDIMKLYDKGSKD